MPGFEEHAVTVTGGKVPVSKLDDTTVDGGGVDMLIAGVQRTADLLDGFGYAIGQQRVELQVKDLQLTFSEQVIARVAALHRTGGGGDPDLPRSDGR